MNRMRPLAGGIVMLVAGACGGVQSPAAPTTSPCWGGAVPHAYCPLPLPAPPTTECQDHELPCAGPATSTTTPVDDPGRKDERRIDKSIDDYMTTTTVALPRTG